MVKDGLSEERPAEFLSYEEQASAKSREKKELFTEKK